MFDNPQVFVINGGNFNNAQGDLINKPNRVEMMSQTTPARIATGYSVATGNGLPTQVSYAHVYDDFTTKHTLYESFCHAMGIFAGLIATIPFVPCPSPFHTIPHGSVGCIYHFGRLSRITDAGLTKVNGWTETLQIMILMPQDVPCGRQVVITRDFVRVEIDLVIYFRIVDPHLVVTTVARPRQAIVGRTEAALGHTMGARDAHAVVTDRKALIREVLEDVKSSAYGWGIAVEDISIADIQLPCSFQF